MKNTSYSQNKHCPDYGKLITNISNKCQSCWQKGINDLPKTKFKKGHISWNRGLTGDAFLKHYRNGHPMKGKKHSEETKNKIRKSHTKIEKHIHPILDIKLKRKKNEIKKQYRKNNHCLDCGALITNYSRRCVFCANKLFKFRKTKVWCEGLTKETDKRLKIMAEKISNTRKKRYKEGKIIVWHKNKTFKEDPRIPNLGGKSYEPYSVDFNDKFKNIIQERDKRCMLCNIGFEDLVELKRQIHVHHIDYDKKNSFPQNCIILCNKCHSLTNHNRDNWKLFFQSLLKQEYKYEYTQDQKIILDFMKED